MTQEEKIRILNELPVGDVVRFTENIGFVQVDFSFVKETETRLNVVAYKDHVKAIAKAYFNTKDSDFKEGIFEVLHGYGCMGTIKGEEYTNAIEELRRLDVSIKYPPMVTFRDMVVELGYALENENGNYILNIDEDLADPLVDNESCKTPADVFSFMSDDFERRILDDLSGEAHEYKVPQDFETSKEWAEFFHKCDNYETFIENPEVYTFVQTHRYELEMCDLVAFHLDDFTLDECYKEPEPEISREQIVDFSGYIKGTLEVSNPNFSGTGTISYAADIKDFELNALVGSAHEVIFEADDPDLINSQENVLMIRYEIGRREDKFELSVADIGTYKTGEKMGAIFRSIPLSKEEQNQIAATLDSICMKEKGKGFSDIVRSLRGGAEKGPKIIERLPDPPVKKKEKGHDER